MCISSMCTSLRVYVRSICMFSLCAFRVCPSVCMFPPYVLCSLHVYVPCAHSERMSSHVYVTPWGCSLCVYIPSVCILCAYLLMCMSSRICAASYVGRFLSRSFHVYVASCVDSFVCMSSPCVHVHNMLPNHAAIL